MVKELPVWKGWTLDLKLRQFRKVEFNKEGHPQLVVAEFGSDEALDLFYDYCQDKYDYHMDEGSDYQNIQSSIEEKNVEEDMLDTLAEEMAKEV